MTSVEFQVPTTWRNKSLLFSLYLIMEENDFSGNWKMDFENRNVTTILNVTQFTIECKRSGCFRCFSSLLFVSCLSYSLLFISNQCENSMWRLNQQINEKISSFFFFNGSRSEFGQWTAISNQSTVFSILFFLWIVNFDYYDPAADFALLNRF